PGWSVVESPVSGLRESLRQSLHQICPHLEHAQLAHLRACDRLDISGEPFLHPVMLVRYDGEALMHQLVDQHPVPLELCFCRVVPEEDAAGRAAVAVCRASAYA